MKLMCHACRKLGEYFKDERLESYGFYSFRCECGEEYLAPIDNPQIIKDEEKEGE